MSSKKFDWFQTARNMCQHMQNSHNMVYKQAQHVVPNKVGQCCANMLRSFCTDLKTLNSPRSL